MSRGGYRRWSFREADSFPLAKALLKLPQKDFDEHMWAIEDMLLDDPFRWSAARPQWGRGFRVAVSEPSEAFPVALMLIFRIDGDEIVKLSVLRR